MVQPTIPAPITRTDGEVTATDYDGAVLLDGEELQDGEALLDGEELQDGEALLDGMKGGPVP